MLSSGNEMASKDRYNHVSYPPVESEKDHKPEKVELNEW